MSTPPVRSPSRSRSIDKMDTTAAPTTTRSPTAPAHNGTISRSPSRSASATRGRTLSRTPTSPTTAPAPRSTKIVIEKLTKNIRVPHLREIFSRFGAIAELEMPVNAHLMTNKGIAYILYETTAEAEEAIASMHEAQLDGAVVNVSIVLPRRRWSRSPERRRPPPDRFGEPHRYGRDGARGGRGGGRGGAGGMGDDRSYRPGAGGPGGYRDRSPLPRFGGGGRGGPRGGGGGSFRDDRAHYRPSYSRSPPPRRGGRRSPSYGYSRSRSRSPRRSLSRSPAPRRRFASPPPRRGGGGGGGGGGRRSPSYDSYDSRRSRSVSRDRSLSRDRGGRRR
ncbi:hypothetical protein MBLNU230_g5385t1 [Neophaeotheca triangularis]